MFKCKFKKAVKFAIYDIFKIKQACIATIHAIFWTKQAVKFATHDIFKIKQACIAHKTFYFNPKNDHIVAKTFVYICNIRIKKAHQMGSKSIWTDW